MDNNFENIDSFYKDKLENYSEDTNNDIFRNMRWTLFWMRYRWKMGLGAIILLLGMAGFIYLGIGKPIDNTTQIITDNSIKAKINNETATDIVNTNEVNSTSEKDDNQTEIAILSETIPYNNAEPTITSKKIIAINTGKTSHDIDDAQDDLMVNSISEEAQLYSDDFSITTIESKHISMDLLVDRDTVFGQNLVQRNNKPSSLTSLLSLVLYAGPAYTQTTISGNNSEYVNHRNANETNYGSWSLGGEIKLHLKNWIITSGLSYSAYNQQRSYMHNYQEYSPDDSFFDYDTTWIWYFDPPEIGVPIVAGIDSNWVKVYNEKSIDNSGINQVRYIEIPLLIGYRFNANMFAFEVNTGTYVGFLSNSSIQAPDFDDNVSIVEVTDVRSTMVNFAVVTSIYYHLNRKTSIFVSPYYKQNLNSVFNNSYPVNQRFKTYGINFGISLSF